VVGKLFEPKEQISGNKKAKIGRVQEEISRTLSILKKRGLGTNLDGS